MQASFIPLLTLCSSMIILFHGACCYHFPQPRTIFKGLTMAANHEYKRQTDSGQCVDDKLDSAGVGSTCKMIGDDDDILNLDIASQSEINTYFREFCRPECGNALIKAYQDCQDINDAAQNLIDFLMDLCGTNKNGDTCYTQYVNARNHFSVEESCFDDYTDFGGCSCQSELSDVVQEQGCCVDAYHDYFTDIYPDFNPRALYNECGVDRPEGCNNSPISGSIPLVSTITTTTAVIISFVLALSSP